MVACCMCRTEKKYVQRFRGKKISWGPRHRPIFQGLGCDRVDSIQTRVRVSLDHDNESLAFIKGGVFDCVKS
jgi:hypothetical protein